MSLVSNEIVRQLEFKAIDFRLILDKFSIQSRSNSDIISLKYGKETEIIHLYTDDIISITIIRRGPPNQ